MRVALVAAVLAAILGPVAWSQEPAWPGPRGDGSVLLPNGWSLRPHGVQVPLGSDLPIRAVLHPGGRWLAVQHAGYRDHQVVIVDTADATGRTAATVPLGRTWSGMAWSPDGGTLYASGGVDDRIRVFGVEVDTGVASSRGELPVGDPDRLDLVAGLAVSPLGPIWTCLQRTHRLVAVDPGGGAPRALDLPDGAYPFECAVAADGGRVFVSLWGLAQVWAVDARTLAVEARIATGAHPSELLLSPDGERLFVSNANENTVTVVDALTFRVEETVSSALYPLAPPGSTPNALALSPDGEHLLIANADNNDLAVIDVGERGRARGIGFVPVGQYPTSVRFAADGSRVFVVNGKGSTGSRANSKGPTPIPGQRYDRADYAGGLFAGSLSIFPFPGPRELAELSARAYACCPLEAAATVRGLALRPADSPVPARVGDPSPIRHVIYVIKENRTYDQVFGDLPQGNGDPALCLFGREVTPNHHALAEQFVLLDNFYVESEVSADGHEWTMGGYATDFVERTWPVTYGGKGRGTLAGGRREDLGYPAEGRYPIAFPQNRYLFDLALEAGVSFRTYGEFVENGPTAKDPGIARYPAVKGHFDPWFRGFDLDARDVDRAARFLEELARFEREGEMPRLIVLRLPNDHTAGTGVDVRTPRAYVADNDVALGMVVEGLSRSRFWPSTAMFVVEDDAQNGPDHVDAHRTVAMVIGPHVRRGVVVSTMYSTCSMLRTMELILGLPPMSQFDAAARPMFDCFVAAADVTGLERRAATWDLEERNGRTAWGAELTETFDLSTEDAADDLLLNEVIWRSVKGAGSAMPRPRRAAFVRVLEGEDE